MDEYRKKGPRELLRVLLKFHQLLIKLFRGKIGIHNDDKMDNYKYHQNTDTHAYNNLDFFRVDHRT